MLLQTLLVLVITSICADAKCPKLCRCALKYGRKTVLCDKGGMTRIPTLDMDLNTHVIIITPPDKIPNNLTIGRIFLKFHQLEEVRVIKSNVPAIGDSSFWPGRRLRNLDLSNNVIHFLQASDFNGLKNLQHLDLSNNNIAATPSAPFRHLGSLVSLSLARNQLQTLVPRFFYLLPQLEYLDLSGNPLVDVDPENLQDVKNLRTLRLAECGLTRIHSLLYQQLPVLEELDLRDNFISALAPEEYRHLKRLRVLYLDNNKLEEVVDSTFDGHSLEHLGLSRNNIHSILSCAFCNSTVVSLDISKNNLAILREEVFQPIASSLEIFNVSDNPISDNSIISVISILKNLKILSISNLGLEMVPRDLFFETPNLLVLNMSHNHLSNLSYTFLHPLKDLQELDLSHNNFASLGPLLLNQLSNTSTLSVLRLHSNPWICIECEILPLFHWVKTSPIYNITCDGDLSENCMQCQQPEHLANLEIASLRRSELPSCYHPLEQPRILVYTSKLGTIVAIAIIVVLVIAIVIIVVLYRRHAAAYYTHEEERPSGGSIYDNPAIAGTNGGFGADKPSFVSAGERVDDIEDIGPPRNNIS